MPTPVSLRAVVDELELLGEGMHVFLNRQTAVLYGGTDEQLAKAEEGDDDLLDWEVDVVHRLREVLGSPDRVELPGRDAHDDYRVMERFGLGQAPARVQEELSAAIRSRGAFGRFRDAVRRLGLEEAWYAFRRDALAEQARAWLESHGIAHGP